MVKHQYLVDWYAVNSGGNSVVQYAKGQAYHVTEETARHVAQGFAEVIEAPDEVVPEAAPEPFAVPTPNATTPARDGGALPNVTAPSTPDQPAAE